MLKRVILTFVCVILFSCGREIPNELLQNETKPLVVVSDIDDTIRLSGGGSLIRKIQSGIRSRDMTFYGFSDIYSAIVARRKDSRPYYVTAAPKTPILNIFKIVRSSVVKGNFPSGEFTGRNPGEDVYEYKMKHHRRIVESNPNADILFLGDDTSQDEPVFQDIKKAYPDRTITALVHMVDNERDLSQAEMRYLAAPDLAMTLLSKSFITQEDYQSVFKFWMQGHSNQKVKNKRIFPTWMKCEGFSKFFRDRIANQVRLEGVRDSIDLYRNILSETCDD